MIDAPAGAGQYTHLSIPCFIAESLELWFSSFP